MGAEFVFMSPWPCPLWSLAEQDGSNVCVPLALLGKLLQVPVDPRGEDPVLHAAPRRGRVLNQADVHRMRTVALKRLDNVTP